MYWSAILILTVPRTYFGIFAHKFNEMSRLTTFVSLNKPDIIDTA